MKYLRISFLIVLVAAFAGCSKKKTDSGTPNVTPTGLVVTSVVSASGDGSVAFTAAATNRVSYDYDFGNGVFQTVASGVVNYTYKAAGSYTVKVTAKSSTGQTVTKSISVVVTFSATPGLVWSDEFDKDGAPDPNNWGYDTGAGGWGNNELEFYTSRTDNATVSNGTLKIIAKKEDYSGSSYTSARLVSNNKFATKYGRIEIKAKLPATAGTWPALWMLGSNYATNPWPACGEMDIMEQTGADKSKILGTFHYPGHSGANGSGGNTVVSDATTAFHVYGLDWTPTTIKMMVDDVTYYTLPNDSSLPFNQNFFFILNVAMGGNLGGTIDPNFTSATMEVDYVRVYNNN